MVTRESNYPGEANFAMGGKGRFATRPAKLVDAYAQKPNTLISGSQQTHVNSKFHKLLTYSVCVYIYN